MDIDKRLNEMEPKDTPLLVLGYILLGMMLLLPATANADDNEVLLNQEGDNVVINILQEGYDNSIDVDLGLSGFDTANTFEAKQEGFNNDVFFSIGGNNNDIQLIQEGNNNEIGWTNSWGSGLSWGGDLDGNDNELSLHQNCTRGTSCGKSDIGFHIQGNSNSIRFGQGMWLDGSTDTTFNNDTDEGGNHTATIDIHGDNNSLAGFQRNGALNNYSGHTATLYLYADDNSLYVQQEYDGSKTLNYTSNVDSSTGHITQKNSGAHTATIVLTGTYQSDVTLMQDSTTAQSYSLSQNCVTVGGCTISVTQDN